MAATGPDVPLVQLALLVLLTGRDLRRSGRGRGRDSIPAARGRGRARHCVCGSGVRVDTWGSVGGPRRDATRGPPARSRCERGVGARASLLPGRGRLPAPEAFGGGTGDRAVCHRVVRHRVPFLPAPLRSPRFLAPCVRPVNVLSGHSDDLSRVAVQWRPEWCSEWWSDDGPGHPRAYGGTRPAATVNAPRLNDGVRLCGTRVTKAPTGSHMSRARGACVTPGNGPCPPRTPCRSPGTGLVIASAVPGSPRRPSPAAAAARAGRCNE